MITSEDCKTLTTTNILETNIVFAGLMAVLSATIYPDANDKNPYSPEMLYIIIEKFGIFLNKFSKTHPVSDITWQLVKNDISRAIKNTMRVDPENTEFYTKHLNILNNG